MQPFDALARVTPPLTPKRFGRGSRVRPDIFRDLLTCGRVLRVVNPAIVQPESVQNLHRGIRDDERAFRVHGNIGITRSSTWLEPQHLGNGIVRMQFAILLIQLNFALLELEAAQPGFIEGICEPFADEVAGKTRMQVRSRQSVKHDVHAMNDRRVNRRIKNGVLSLFPVHAWL